MIDGPNTYKNKYYTLKEAHLKVVNDNLDLIKQMHDLRVEKNEIATKLDKYKVRNEKQEQLLKSILKTVYSSSSNPSKVNTIKNILNGVE